MKTLQLSEEKAKELYKTAKPRISGQCLKKYSGKLFKKEGTDAYLGLGRKNISIKNT